MSETILIIDAEPAQLQMSEYTVQYKLGYGTIKAGSCDEAMRYLLSETRPQPDLILLDMGLPGQDSQRFMQNLRARKRQIPIIALVNYGDKEKAVQAVKSGARDFLDKPVTLERFRLTIQCALKMQRMSDAIAALEHKNSGHVALTDIVGRSPLVKATLALAEKAAWSATPVWIEGECGTGKELLARAIHGSGDRAGKPFVVVDCMRLPEDKGEALMFGQEERLDRIQPSPQQPQRRILGKMREADGGTLFLKEVCALPKSTQQRLLETLKDATVTPLGSYASIPVNVRVICSSSKDMGGLVSEGVFSEALHRKLRDSMIFVSPLRERREDIAPLANHFLAHFSATENKYIAGLADDAASVLEANPWPGNVRQLANLLWRAAILCNHDQMDAGNIRLIQQLEPVHYLERNHQGVTSDVPTLVDMEGHIKNLKSIEEEVIRFTLKYSNGCMTRAARTLGIGRSTLYRRMNEMA